MARDLRKKRKAVSVEGQENACPICMEGTEHDRVCFPCGHWVCSPCDARMLANGFLACPTCRTPREGVSQGQVELANRARTERHAEQDRSRALALREGGQVLQVLFFPDESEGAHPFGPLDAGAGAASRPVLLRLEGQMRELVDQLLRPGSLMDFLAQRELVRDRHRVRRRAPSTL